MPFSYSLEFLLSESVETLEHEVMLPCELARHFGLSFRSVCLGKIE